MTLSEQVKDACGKLSDAGWAQLLLQFGLDINAPDLEAELSRPLEKLRPGKRPRVAGFEDFSRQGVRGIEPGIPDRSLLFHAFASPSVPANGSNLSSSFAIPFAGAERRAPEYIHVRHELLPNGTIRNLNDPRQVPDLVETVKRGGYEAVHYIDFTGDGWIEAKCDQLQPDGGFVPAYSLVTAPDFFFSCSQRDLLEWWEDTSRRIVPSIPDTLKKSIWRISPDTLADQRIAPNLQLDGAGFTPDDNTATAIVSLPISKRGTTEPVTTPEPDRHACLPDAASGVYAPGWDVSQDKLGDVPHLAAYGLGSPFPEDAKLCAALSTFWPAVAPDVARTFNPNGSEPGAAWPTVCPLTDQEIGITGDLPLDGYPGPRLLADGKTVEYTSFAHADYVQSALKNEFSLALTSRINVVEYRSRVLAMARAYRALGIREEDFFRSGARGPFGAIVREKARWAVLSFRETDPTDPDVQEAQQKTQVSLIGDIYRFRMYRHGPGVAQGDKVLVPVLDNSLTLLLLDASRTLKKQEASGQWEEVRV